VNASLQPIQDRVLVERITETRRGLLWIPEVAEPDKAARGKVLAVGPKARGLKAGDEIAFTGRWDDLPEIHALGPNLQLIREGDVMGIFGD
jgi:co-chaperonin GroES (HSP10)